MWAGESRGRVRLWIVLNSQHSLVVLSYKYLGFPSKMLFLEDSVFSESGIKVYCAHCSGNLTRINLNCRSSAVVDVVPTIEVSTAWCHSNHGCVEV